MSVVGWVFTAAGVLAVAFLLVLVTRPMDLPDEDPEPVDGDDQEGV